MKMKATKETEEMDQIHVKLTRSLKKKIIKKAAQATIDTGERVSENTWVVSVLEKAV